MSRFFAIAGLILAAFAPAHAGADDRLLGAWQRYKQKFVMADGRVVDSDNGNISHSEGQGYVMLLAARLDDRDTFARVWAWTKANLTVRDDGLAAWRWDPKSKPHVGDKNNATDGDMLMAWALLEGGAEWRRADYADAGKEIADKIATTLVAASRYGPILKPGAEGFGLKEQPDGPVVNLSYWIFPALARLEQADGAGHWAALAASGRQLIEAARFGPRRLPSNWVSLAGDRPRAARAFPPVFGYDAIRIPLYLAWGSVEDRKLLRSFGPFDLTVIEVESGKPRERLADSDYSAIIQLAACVASPGSTKGRRQDFHLQSYYPATLSLLAHVAARDMKMSACLE